MDTKQKMRILAVCFSTPDMESLEFVKPSYGKKYPGAGWMRHLQSFCCDGISMVTTGKRAIELLQDKGINASDVYIIQEENNEDGVFLQGMGANKSVIMCLESPIYASSFYDTSVGATGFKHRLFFNGGTEHLCFPSFDYEDIRDPVPWTDRKFLCMVTANKHYSMLPEHKTHHPDVSSSLGDAMKTQLQDYRYEAIAYFAKKPGFQLYGRGWPNGLGAECADKLATISQYKFALCFENGSYPGYITEKVIDCFVAGVVPVYMGAPDSKEFISDEHCIDGNRFSSFSEMESFLNRCKNWTDWMQYCIPEFQKWLRSTEGKKYNNLHFAKRIVEMCE